MKKKLISTLLVVTLTSVFLYGCAGDSDDPLDAMSKSELRQAYNDLDSAYDDLLAQFEALNTMYNATSNTDVPTSSISVIGDGTNRMTFNSLDSRIIFPEQFMYPGTEPVAATGSLNITRSTSVVPGTNWTMKMNGSSVDLEHSGGISGTILIGQISSLYDSAQLQNDVLAPWFADLPETQVKYKDIFVNGQKFGVQASTPTMIDSESAYLRCGMVGYGPESLVYIFVYRGPQDAIKDESEMAVINSIVMNGQQIIVDA